MVKIIDPGRMFAEFAAIKSRGGKKSCTKGLPCGGSCIAANKKCKSELPNQTKPLVAAVKKVKPTKADVVTTSRTGSGNATSTVRTNQEREKKTRDKIIAMYGEAEVKAAESKLARLLEGASVRIRVKSFEAIEEILKDRFKNAVEIAETGQGAGSDYTAWRKEKERVALGVPSGTESKNRPIYGYMTDRSISDDLETDRVAIEPLNMYGLISLEMKPSLKERATFIAGKPSTPTADKTSTKSANNGVASRVVKQSGETPPPNIASLFDMTDDGEITNKNNPIEVIKRARSLEDIRVGLDNPYIETQLHGQVRGGDIKTIHIPASEVWKYAGRNYPVKDRWNTPTNKDGDVVLPPKLKGLEEEAARLGIKINIMQDK